MKIWMAALVGFSSMAVGAATESPVVVLYEQRVEMERNELERQKTNAVYTTEMKDRLESISSAVPEGTLKAVAAENDLAQIRVKTQETRVRLAEAMLDIARARVGGGREMPFCSMPQVRELNDADFELPVLLKGGR